MIGQSDSDEVESLLWLPEGVDAQMQRFDSEQRFNYAHSLVSMSVDLGSLDAVYDARPDVQRMNELINGPQADLVGQNLAHLYLERKAIFLLSFHRAEMTGFYAKDCSFSKCLFPFANLPDAHFKGCSVKDSSFEGCNLVNARFKRVDLSGTDFADADLTGAEFTSCNLYQCNFDGARMDDVRMKDCTMPDGSHTDPRLKRWRAEQAEKARQALDERMESLTFAIFPHAKR